MKNLRRNLIGGFAAAQLVLLVAWFGPFAHHVAFALFLLIPAGVLIGLLRTASHGYLARGYILLCLNAMAFLIYSVMSFGGV